MSNFLTKKLAIFLLKEKYTTFDSTLKSNSITKYKLKDDIENEGLVVIGHEKRKSQNGNIYYKQFVKKNSPI
ncbi:hypothetical protein [Epilithonimonas sp. UC225_85]|uniref:hypothetical protein n=1 Tax=Epilithonimonas sp. UC225_85 TaxID=3350167 RepID=UPI0036D35640